MVCVRVRLEHADDAHAFALGRFQVRFDRERRVDDDRLARVGVADEVRAATEVVVDELPKQHVRRLVW